MLTDGVNSGLLTSSQVFNKDSNLNCLTGEFLTTDFESFNRFSLLVTLGGFSLLERSGESNLVSGFSFDFFV